MSVPGLGSGRKRFVHHGQGFRSLGGGSRYGGQGRGQSIPYRVLVSRW
jgi:hypothetical protein